ncbi:MAG: hypothetical protein R3F60_28105 [bacterium]
MERPRPSRRTAACEADDSGGTGYTLEVDEGVVRLALVADAEACVGSWGQAGLEHVGLYLVWTLPGWFGLAVGEAVRQACSQVVFTSPPRRVSMARPMYFHLISSAHHKYLMAGDEHDGHVYHQDLESNGGPRHNAGWTFEKVSGTGNDAIYYIQDQKHGRYLVAGDEYDGAVYHLHHEDRRNAQWKLEEIQPDCFYIRDMKHGNYLVAGDDDDGHIYHQPHRDRLNARWRFEFANTDKTGFDWRDVPAFLVVDEVVESFQADRETLTSLPDRPSVFTEFEWMHSGGSWRGVHGEYDDWQDFEGRGWVECRFTVRFHSEVTEGLARSILSRLDDMCLGVFDVDLAETAPSKFSGDSLAVFHRDGYVFRDGFSLDSKMRVLSRFRIDISTQSLPWEAKVVRTTAVGLVLPAEVLKGTFEGDRPRVQRTDRVFRPA